MRTNSTLERFAGCHLQIVVCVATVVLGVVSARAGIATLDSQTRFVLVSVPQSPSTPSQTVKQTASDFGPFNATVSSAQFTTPVPWALQIADQSSTISNGSGALVIDDSATATAPNITLSGLDYDSYFDLKFILSAPATFTGTYESSAGSRYGPSPGVNSSFTGPGAPGVLRPPPPGPGQPPPGSGQPALSSYSGTLQPGDFEVLADLKNVSGSSAELGLHFTIVSEAVPLPPAAWASLATLPLLVLAVSRLRKQAMRRHPR